MPSIPEERKPIVISIAVGIILSVGYVLASIGIAHFIPQWSGTTYWWNPVEEHPISSFAYISLEQLSLNSWGFSALVIGTTMVSVVLICSVYLIKEKIAAYFKSKENDPQKTNLQNYKPIIAVALISIAISITLFILSSHLLQNLDTRHIYFYGFYDDYHTHVVEGVMMISQTQFDEIIGLGASGAFTSGIALFSLGKLIASTFRSKEDLEAKPYSPHNDV